MDVIVRCHPEDIRAGGVTVRHPAERSLPPLRHGADLQTVDRVFVWSIGFDLSWRGSVSTARQVGKRFETQASVDAQAPMQQLGNQDLQELRENQTLQPGSQSTSYSTILGKINEFLPSSVIGLSLDEVRFLDGLYGRTVTIERQDAEEDQGEAAAEDQLLVDDDLASDISDILHDPTLSSETERRALVKTRLGQGPFRTRLIERWGGRCPVTGCSQEQALRASHVKPWRCSTNEERLNPANGLLLTANVDALFDRFLISFDEDGRMLISPQIELACYEMLGIPGSPIRGLSAEERRFLAFHRAQAGLS
jgi:hypothetical protein